MWTLFLYTLLWSLSQESELQSLLSATDQFFDEFQVADGLVHVKDLELFIRRSYDLYDETENEQREKRSVKEEDSFVRDPQGVYLLNNIQDIYKIPAKFPNDINVFSIHNILFITTLEANGTNPEYELANNLVLYQYSSIQGIRELGRVPVLGGVKTAIYSFYNSTYFISAEHDANKNPDSFQGSTVYKLVEQKGKIYLEKIQVLNVIEPNDVKFWEHQNQLYLAVGTSMENDTTRSGTLIYRWLGYHFDCLQIIPSKHVKSIMPFTIGSFMFLAVANFQDERGNIDIDSEIYHFSLQEIKFRLYQKIKTHGAEDFYHFKFEDNKAKKSEHFLIVANSLSKDSNKSLNPLTESVVYKFVGNYFIPFQSFKLHGANQWLPIQGSNGEFLLLAGTLRGVVGYQYDGWRFTEISLQFSQSYFGDNIQSMRYFQYFGDIFLTMADKNSYGTKINVWKLEFTNRNDLEKKYNEIQTWCSEMEKKLDEDEVDELVYEETSEAHEKLEQVQGESFKAGGLNEELTDELKRLNEELKKLEEELKGVEDELEHYKDSSEQLIVIGIPEIASLEIKCDTKDCCSFKNLEIVNLNGKYLPEFLNNIVFVDEGVTESVLEFQNVVLDKDVTSLMVNGHPAETLLDVSSNTLINANIVLNGTVHVKGNLNVSGLYNGFPPDRQHLLLKDNYQEFDDNKFKSNLGITSDKLVVDTLKVKNLILTGKLNGQQLDRLLHQPKIKLDSSYDELNVNNLYVEGLIDGFNVSRVFNDTLTISGDQDIQGSLKVNTLEVEKVVVESEKVSDMSVPEVIRAYEDYLCEPFIDEVDNSLDSLNFKAEDESDTDINTSESQREITIIVQGFLKAKDIIDGANTTSLFDIVTNSYELTDPVIDAEISFTNIVANDVEVGVINDVPCDTWVLKTSNDTQYIEGKKTFHSNILIQKKVSVDFINGINLKELEKDALRLDGYQTVPHDIRFESITCRDIETNYTNFGNRSLNQLNRLVLNDSITMDTLQVDDLTIFGDIDFLSWKNLTEDSIFDGRDLIVGEKTIGVVQIKRLNIDGRINDLLFDEFVAMMSQEANKILIDTNVTLDNPLIIEEFHFEGTLNSVLQKNFEGEWLLQDETQIITGPVTFENVDLKSGCSLMNETINNISLRKLFTKSLKINEDTKIKYLFGMDKIIAKQIQVGGNFNGANFEESVVLSQGKSDQEILGEWFVSDEFVVNGNLIIEGNFSGLNLSYLCGFNSEDKINLVVGGSIEMNSEPKVRFTTNGIDLAQKSKGIWMATENTTLRRSQVQFRDVVFENKTRLSGTLNSINSTYLSKYYLSKTENRVISADFEFDELVIENSCRMHRAQVGGNVNGVNLTHWAKNVLLQDEEQVVQGKLHFEVFHTKELNLEGTVNGLDLSKDVLRMDVEDAIVEGEKTFDAIHVVNLTMAEGKTVQGVDIDAWRTDMVKTEGDFNIEGNLVLKDAVFNAHMTVNGKVNGINFDSQHLLTTAGNQVVTGVKRFNNQNRPPIRIRFFEVSGLVDDIDLEGLIKNQAYSNRDLVFSAPKTFTNSLSVDSMEIDGLFYGVNISRMCHDIFNPIDVNSQKDEFYELLNKTEDLIDFFKDRAFFFDYFELIQTLKPNVRAVVPTLDISLGHNFLAVFTPKQMRFLNWDKYSESFVNTDEGLDLNDNITFVTSETYGNRSFLYIETTKSTTIFEPSFLKEIQKTDTACVAFFFLKPLNKSCIFIGQKWNSSRILCNSFVMNDLQTYQTLESKGSVQVTTLNIEDEIYIAAINKEEVFDKVENTLSIYRFDRKLQHFYISRTLAEVNPVAVSSISYKNDYYLVSAGGHLPESVHNSVLSIFKFNKHHKDFIRSQSIRVDTPVDVRFALLPSLELALYVLTSNPTKPFVVFLHKGISGFVEETSGLSLYAGSNLYSFTDSLNQHFVVISGFGRGQILRAGFKGSRTLV